MAVGGSTTEGFYLSDGRTWPERLAVRLRPEMRKVWVNNAGLDGHSTFGHLLLTRQAIVPLHPKVMLYLVGVNDMFADAPRGFDRVAQNRWAALADHSELAATLLNLYRWKRTRRFEDLGAMPKPVALRDRPQPPRAAGSGGAPVAGAGPPARGVPGAPGAARRPSTASTASSRC